MNLGKKGKKRTWGLPNYYFNPPDKTAGEVNNYSFGKFPVTVCPKCETAWEYGLVGKKRIPVYYDDFPIFKLKKIECPKCKDKNKKEQA